MRHSGHVVSRSMILEHVWDLTFGGLTNVVDVHINRLRNKIDRGRKKPLIHTPARSGICHSRGLGVSAGACGPA